MRRPTLPVARLQQALVAQGWEMCLACGRPMAPGTLPIHRRVMHHEPETLSQPSVKVGKETVADRRD